MLTGTVKWYEERIWFRRAGQWQRVFIRMSFRSEWQPVCSAAREPASSDSKSSRGRKVAKRWLLRFDKRPAASVCYRCRLS